MGNQEFRDSVESRIAVLEQDLRQARERIASLENQVKYLESRVAGICSAGDGSGKEPGTGAACTTCDGI